MVTGFYLISSSLAVFTMHFKGLSLVGLFPWEVLARIYKEWSDVYFEPAQISRNDFRKYRIKGCWSLFKGYMEPEDNTEASWPIFKGYRES